MDDMRGLVLKAALLRMKRADDNTPYGNYALGAGEGLASVGLLAGTGNWARNTYNRIHPSFLQMAEQTWQDPEHLEGYKRLLDQLGPGRGEQVLNAVRQNPSTLRSVLTRGGAPGIPDEAADVIRQATFGGTTGSGNVSTRAQAGDVMMGDIPDSIVTKATGLPHVHAGIVGPGENVYSYGAGLGRGATEVLPLEDMRQMGGAGSAFVRLRDTGLTPEQRAGMETAIPETYKNIKRFNFGRRSAVTAREVLPETATAEGGSWLAKPFNWLAGNKTTNSFLKNKLPTQAYNYIKRVGKSCGPGEVCSTAVGRALENVGAPLKHQTTPGDIFENVGPGKRFRVQETYLPEGLRNPEFLNAMHNRRLLPALARAPFMLGGAALGAYGLYNAAQRFAPPEGGEKSMAQLMHTPPPAPAPPQQLAARHAMPEQPPAPRLTARQQTVSDLKNTFKGAVGNLWHHMSNRYLGGPA
jgi:hypothetical protein